MTPKQGIPGQDALPTSSTASVPTSWAASSCACPGVGGAAGATCPDDVFAVEGKVPRRRYADVSRCRPLFPAHAFAAGARLVPVQAVVDGVLSKITAVPARPVIRDRKMTADAIHMQPATAGGGYV